MKTHQPELPLYVLHKRRRCDSAAACLFFALGDRLRREMQAERLQKIRTRAH